MTRVIEAVGGEVLVNTETGRWQYTPVVAALPGGGFVMAWADDSGTGGDADASSIKAQVFDADGTKVGGEVLVNTTAAQGQYVPAIAALPDGGFVLAWDDYSGVGGDADGGAVKAQMFDAAGTKVGGETLVNTSTAGWQHEPAIVSLPGGGFVVTWDDWSGRGSDASGAGIKAQLFDAAGQPVGGEVLVNTTMSGHQSHSAVTALPGGGYVVAWDDRSGTGGDTDGAVRAQTFDAAGSKVGGEIAVNTVTAGLQHEPAVAALTGGGFVIAWNEDNGAGDVAKAQVFDAAGNRIGGEIVVGDAGGVDRPTVAALPGGGFVVAWDDHSGVGSDPNGTKAQLFDANGNRVGGEVQVNLTTVGSQDTATVAVLTNGRFVVGWVDHSGRNGDTDGSGINARLFEVVDPNVAPVARDTLRTVPEDALIFGQVAATDADGDALTYTLVQGAQDADGHAVAGLTFNADGSYVFQGPQDFHGTVTFTYVASDGTAVSNTAVMALAMTPANDAPMAPTLGDRFLPEDQPLLVRVPAFADVDGDALTYAATLADGAPLPAWLSFDAATRSFSGQPPANLNGPLGLTVTASDGQVTASDTFSLTITPVNDAPVGAAIPDRVFLEDQPLSFQVPAFADADGDALAYSATLASGAPLPAWLSFDVATRTFSGTPPANFAGALDVRVSASDGSASASDTFRLTIDPVNDAPVAAAIPDRAFAEDHGVSFRVPAFADADGDALAYAATLASGGALPVWLTFDAATRTFSGQPPANWTGALDVRVSAGDGQLTASDTFRLSLTPVSDAPVAGADTLGGPGQAPIHDGAQARIDVTALLANDLDPDGGPVRFAGIAAGPGKGTLDTVTEGGRTYLLYEYAGAQLGAGATAGDAFTHTVVDASGATATATASLTVTGLPGKQTDGTGKADTLDGGGLHHDIIDAGDGRDIIFGHAGHDRLFGGSGDDKLHGGDGADLAFGGTGRDRLRGDGGNDKLEGGGGDDGLSGGTGHDHLDGGAGTDAAFGQAGRDRLLGGRGDDRLKGEGGADTLHGGTGRDSLSGGTDDDGLHGEGGADGLRGGQGADRLWGGSGGDTLNGGSGRDHLWAGQDSSRDVFVFGSVADSRVASRDVLHDFDRGEDAIDLRGIDALDYTGPKPGAHSVWWTQEHDGVVVSSDVTGDGVADFQIVVAAVSSLGRGDFLL